MMVTLKVFIALSLLHISILTLSMSYEATGHTELEMETLLTAIQEKYEFGQIIEYQGNPGYLFVS